MVIKLLLVALIVLGGAEPAGAPHAAGVPPTAGVPPVKAASPAAGVEFRKALLGELTPDERVAALESIVKEYPESRWADDALWVLGEVARQQGLHDKVIYYWHFLIAEHPHMVLEEFTRTLGLYQMSGLPQVQFYLNRTGISYVPQEGARSRLPGTQHVLVNAKAFNPVPMHVWEGLARSYTALGKHKPALGAYRNAHRAAPEGGPWRKRFEARIRKLERLVPREEPGPSSSEGEQQGDEKTLAAPALPTDDPNSDSEDDGADGGD